MTDVILNADAPTVVEYNWTDNAFLNMFYIPQGVLKTDSKAVKEQKEELQVNPTNVAASYTLYATNGQPTNLMKQLGAKEHLGKRIPGFMLINDLSTYKQREFDVNAHSLKIAGEAFSFSPEQEEELHRTLQENYETWKDVQSNPNDAELERIQRHGKIIAYMNLYGYATQKDGSIVQTRIPGSKALRAGRRKDVTVYSISTALAKVAGNPVAEDVFFEFAWANSALNTHKDKAMEDDYSNLVGL